MRRLLLFLLSLPFLTNAQTIISNNLSVTAPKALDYRTGKFVGGAWIPYATTTEANTAIPSSRRYEGLTLCIGTATNCTEYWYHGGIADGNLVLKYFSGTSSQVMTGAGTVSSIKTINGNTLLGSGDITISGGGGSTVATLIHYWNFNDITSEATLLAEKLSIMPSTARITITNGGTSALNVAGGTGQNFSVLNQNSRNGDSSGTHLRFDNPIGGAIVFSIPTRTYADPVVKFTTRRSGSGAGTQTWSYSLNGSTYTVFTTISPLDADPQAQTLDFSAISGADNNDSFKVKVEFSLGSGGAAGNNRFDNFSVDATPTGAAPNPTILANISASGGGSVDSQDVVDIINGLEIEYVSPSFHTVSGNYTVNPDSFTRIEWDRSGGDGTITIPDVTTMASKAVKELYIAVTGTGSGRLTVSGATINGVNDPAFLNTGLVILTPGLIEYSATQFAGATSSVLTLTASSNVLNWNYLNGSVAEAEWADNDSIALTNAPAGSSGTIILAAAASGKTIGVSGYKTDDFTGLTSVTGNIYKLTFQRDNTRTLWSLSEYGAASIPPLSVDTMNRAGPYTDGTTPLISSGTWTNDGTNSGSATTDSRQIAPGDDGGVMMQVDTTWGGLYHGLIGLRDSLNPGIGNGGFAYSFEYKHSTHELTTYMKDNGSVTTTLTGKTDGWFRLFIDRSVPEARVEYSPDGTSWTRTLYTYPLAPNSASYFRPGQDVFNVNYRLLHPKVINCH